MAKGKEERVQYWISTSERDYQTVEHLIQSADYSWALFIGHLVLEKLFKALYVARSGEDPPPIHDLGRLAEKCGLAIDETVLGKLDVISRFNIAVRYPDYRQEIYRICTKEYTSEVLRSINEVRAWLQKLIQQS